MSLTFLDLTPQDLEELDPTGACQSAVRRKFCGVAFEDPSPDYTYDLEEITEFSNRSYGERHTLYHDFNRSYLKKLGPQGGTNTLEWLLSTLELYYEKAQRHVTFSPVLLRGRDFFIRRVARLIEVYGIAQPVQVPVYHTFAGIPSGGHKGTWVAEASYDHGKQFRHVLPCVPGYRYTKGKPRAIFQAALSNVRLVESSLAAVRKWLVKYLPEWFSAEENPANHLRRIVTTAVDKGDITILFDYEKMDTGFSWEVFETIVAPIYELLLPPGEYNIFMSYMEEMFHEPLFLGTRLVVGKHNLFSGEPPTHDVETIFSVINALATALLHETQAVRILACGDDLALSFRKRVGVSTVSYLRDRMVEVSSMAGLTASADKCDVVTGYVKFCKKLYYQAGPREPALDGGSSVLIGSYPTVLALGNLRWPESLSKSSGMRAISDFQRLDNCYGSVDFVPVVQFAASHRKSKDWTISLDDVTKYSSKDWWYRLYGESFNPKSSRVYQVLLRSGFNPNVLD